MKRLLALLALLVAVPTQAHVFCVSDSATLATALSIARSNGEDDIVRLVRGTYVGAGFSFNSSEALGLEISGGYDAGCASSDHDASHTVLDAGGLRQVLETYTPGAVSLAYLTVQNGVQNGSSGGGLQLGGSGAGSAVTLRNLIVRNNSSDYAVGRAVVYVDGEVRLENNLFVGNSAPGSAALYIYAAMPGSVYLINNTFNANAATSAGNAAVYLNSVGSGVNAYVSSNIFWGNNADMDFGFFAENVQLSNNDIGILSGSAAGSSGNVSVDPGFKAADDWHLRPDSPLRDAGLLNPPGGLPSFDIEGQPRSYNASVDMGAYQHGDRIFADNFGG